MQHLLLFAHESQLSTIGMLDNIYSYTSFIQSYLVMYVSYNLGGMTYTNVHGTRQDDQTIAN